MDKSKWVFITAEFPPWKYKYGSLQTYGTAMKLVAPVCRRNNTLQTHCYCYWCFLGTSFLLLILPRPFFWETEMSNSKKSRIIFGLFYFGVFSSLAWPWHNKLMASHFYGASQGLERLVPAAPVGQYAEAWICSRKMQLFSLLLPTPHPLPLLIRASCTLLHDIKWWPISYLLHWPFHWPASMELAEKPQGEVRPATPLWDLQGMHGSCKEQQGGTEGKGIPWSCTGRGERLRLKQLWLVSLVSS